MTRQITYSKFQQPRRDALYRRAARALGPGSHDAWLMQGKMDALARDARKLFEQKQKYDSAHHEMHVNLAQQGGSQEDWDEFYEHEFTPVASFCSLLIGEIGAADILASIDEKDQEATRVSAYFKTESQPQPLLSCGVIHVCLSPRRFSTATTNTSA